MVFYWTDDLDNLDDPHYLDNLDDLDDLDDLSDLDDLGADKCLYTMIKRTLNAGMHGIRAGVPKTSKPEKINPGWTTQILL